MLSYLPPGIDILGSAGGRPRHARGDAGKDFAAARKNLGRGGRLRRRTSQVRGGAVRKEKSLAWPLFVTPYCRFSARVDVEPAPRRFEFGPAHMSRLLRLEFTLEGQQASECGTLGIPVCTLHCRACT